MNPRALTILLVASSAFVVLSTACSSSTEDDEGSSEGAASTSTTVTLSGYGTLGIPQPAGPGVRPTPAPLAVDRVLDAWRGIRKEFYETQNGYSDHTSKLCDGKTPGCKPVSVGGAAPMHIAKPTATTAPVAALDVPTCVAACPDNWSDIVCHFYCWMPAYDSVWPNIRGCFTNLAREGIPDEGSTTTKPIVRKLRPFPEIYDYCTYESYDAVTQSQDINQGPNWDPAVINAKKRNPDGVLTYVDTAKTPQGYDLRDAFKHVMFTWYEVDAYDKGDQAKAISAFYNDPETKKLLGANDVTRSTPASSTPLDPNGLKIYEARKAAMTVYWNSSRATNGRTGHF